MNYTKPTVLNGKDKKMQETPREGTARPCHSNGGHTMEDHYVQQTFPNPRIRSVRQRPKEIWHMKESTFTDIRIRGEREKLKCLCIH